MEDLPLFHLDNDVKLWEIPSDFVTIVVLVQTIKMLPRAPFSSALDGCRSNCFSRIGLELVSFG